MYKVINAMRVRRLLGLIVVSYRRSFVTSSGLCFVDPYRPSLSIDLGLVLVLVHLDLGMGRVCKVREINQDFIHGEVVCEGWKNMLDSGKV